MRHIKINKKLGFTLVELMVVMILVAILATMSVILFTGGRDKARNAVRDADVRGIVSSARAMRFNEGAFPTKPSEFRDRANPYISHIPSDPGSGKILTSLDEPLPSYDTQEYTFAFWQPPQDYSDDRILVSTYFEQIGGEDHPENIHNGRYAIGTMMGPISKEMWTQGVPYDDESTNGGTILLDDRIW